LVDQTTLNAAKRELSNRVQSACGRRWTMTKATQ
jgi:hypothetical protein